MDFLRGICYEKNYVRHRFVYVFNNAFAKVQKELVLKSIRDLNIDVSSREKVLCFFAKMLREQIKRD